MLNNNPTFRQLFIWRFSRGIDQQLVIAVSILIALSILLVATTSSSVALRIGASEDFFSKRHFVYLLFTILIMIMFSTFSIEFIKRFGILLFIVNVALLIFVKFFGFEVKGARRWINIFGFSLQPSEFIKPFFAIMTAYIFSIFISKNISLYVSFVIYFLCALLLVLQPDIGMLVTLSGIYGSQLFVAGLPFIYIMLSVVTALIGIFVAYNFLPHVTSRIDSFLNPTIHENYQVLQSLKAFKSGGLFGKGPGEGVVKYNIPDSHADFIFSVAGEEFGIIICVFISLIFGFIVIRSLLILANKDDEFIILAGSGLISQIAIQSIVNMGVALNLLPTKGMTLPFISYGGSSTIAMGISIGIILAFTKVQKLSKKYNILEELDE